MDKQKIKEILYSLYVLHTYEKDENPSKTELNSIMLKTIEKIDVEITNKEQLISRIKDILNYRFKYQSFSKNQTIEFKIGEIINTSISSSNINLKFIFHRINETNIINVFEKEKKILTIKL